jgi:hypothetical protein
MLCNDDQHMPYAKPADWKVAHREWYIDRYHADPKFQRAESKRKADWYAAKASDPAWLAEQAAKKRAQRAKAKGRK